MAADDIAEDDDNWKAAWDPVIASVGRDFGGDPIVGADAVELGLIRRFCEPLEFGCPLHHDAAAAEAAGYGGVIAPVSSLLMFSIAPMWSSGDPPLFTTAGRDDQPARSPVKPPSIDGAPPTTGYFATDIEFDFEADMHLGDRIRRVGNVLLSCEPKQTRVGRGAFTKWQWEMRNQRDEVVAVVRTGLFFYNAGAAA